MIKLFENFNNKNLVEKLKKQILSDKKNINGFTVSTDLSVSLMWEGNDYFFYSTPYWDDNDQLPIEIFDVNTNEIDNFYYDLGTINKSDDINEKLHKYYDIINIITKRLNKRSNIVNTLKKIYDNIPDDIYEKDLLENNPNDFHDLDLTELENVYNDIESYYPELIIIYN